MTPAQWDKVTNIFHRAVELEGDDRIALLDRECAGDFELRHEVESLLNANSNADDFIENPAIDLKGLIPGDLPLAAGTSFGHYEILKSIGRGGMGEVYLALDTRLNRKVALKKLPDEYVTDPVFRTRFRNEARSAATLNHPNVATIYSIEELDGKPFITMEYVEGRTLDAMTPPAGLEIRSFLDWFIQLADALQHAHERGITHRDIKPGNMMVSTSGVPKILDFGLAQVGNPRFSSSRITDGLTEPGQIMGTPSYMSPEQAEGKDVDTRSDIFSFGVVMYEALTGVRPFAGGSHAELVSNLLKSEPPPVSDLRPEVPALISRLVSRCLAKRRRERLQQMQEAKTILTEARALLKKGASTPSLARRLYGEARGTNPLWRAGAVLATVVASIAAWYIFSAEARPQIYFENVSIRSLSQSHDVVFAQISPDGKSMAYNTIEKNQDRSLWIRRIDDRNALLLVPPKQQQYWGGLTISDDSSHVYFVTADPTARFGTLYRVSSLGGPVRKLVETVNDLGSLSPDGKRILFVRYGDPTSVLTASSEDGSDEKAIVSFPEGTVLRDPVFSLDGSSVFFIRMARKNGVEYWSLERINLANGRISVVIPEQQERIGEVALVGKSGDLIINAADAVTGASQLFYVSMPSGRITRVTNDLNTYFGVSVDRSGTQIVTAQRNFERRLLAGYSGDLPSLKAISTDINAYLRVDWTPDGRVVFDAVENNHPHIWIAGPDGSEIQQLTPSDSSDQYPVVSKDGRYIVFTSSRSGHNQIWRMNIDGSNQIWLARVDGVATNAQISHDNENVIFQWDGDGSRKLGRVSIEGGDVEELPLFGESHWALSPDGSKVGYSFWNDRENNWQVAVRALDGNAQETILDLSPYFIFKWNPDGSGFIYRDRRAIEFAHASIYEWKLGAATPVKIFSAEPDTVQDFAFSRDGKMAAAIVGKLNTDAVLLSKRP